MNLVKRIQETLGLKQDGFIGPITRAAIAKDLGLENDSIKSIQRAVGVEDDGEIGPITLNAIANAIGVRDIPVIKSYPIIDIALNEEKLNIRENSKNQGPGIKKYWLATWYEDGYENREPWCAAFICWCIKESGKFSESSRPKTPAAFGFETWANDHPSLTNITKKPKGVAKGDIVVFTFSHIAIATSDSDSAGYFATVEGNTNAAGSREGNGVYKKVRNVSSVRSTISLV